MYKTVSEIKKSYLSYFQSKGHTVVKSSSLIPVGDPTLLFTTAGMVQFKPLFTGAVELPYTRATTAQKCLRTTDLENVGKTERHCTFFEMLGNFSFGDYFKKDAIEYALEFSVKHLGFPIEKIWITVYLDDEEAIEMWVHAGIPRERIVKLGKADNFWGPAGDSGACGPCSELYLDRGKEKGSPECGVSQDCKPGCSCDRYLEFWNLVFNQFNQDTEGVLHPLKQTGIDTGSGLERVALLLQGVDSVYETDQLKRIILEIENLTGLNYNKSDKNAFRVLTDHSRSITFAISDGIYPDKTGRGYVIRRIIRRASLFARKLNQKEPFLYKLIPTVVEIYKEEYPELKEREIEIQKIVLGEEKLFLNTLEIGLVLLEDLILSYKNKNQTLFSGKELFRLYGTYGFPREMMKEILLENHLEFDEQGFEEELQKDRNLSRDSWKGKKQSFLGENLKKIPSTLFTGYDSTTGEGSILAISQGSSSVSSLKAGEDGWMVLSSSSFYGESGGQIGDTGFIKSGDSIFQVLDTQKENDRVIHIGRVLKGEIKLGRVAITEADDSRRNLLTYHHSGTHLLHGALRRVLGIHVSQKASLVSNEYLRFDFSHPSSMKEDEILKVEEDVNHAIQKSIPVSVNVYDLEEAKKTGAVAFFEEKYGDKVRVVQMGEFSSEFCGGCHVNHTGEIGYFMILKESSPGAGNRRIEALCGEKVPEYFQTEFQILKNSVSEFNLKSKEITGNSSLFITSQVPTPEEIQMEFKKEGSKGVGVLRKKRKHLLDQLEQGKEKLIQEKKAKDQQTHTQLLTFVDEIYMSRKEVSGIYFFHSKFSHVKMEALKELGDTLKNKYPSSLLFFVNSTEESDALLFMAGKEAVSRKVNSGEILKKVSILLGGKGGGKPEMAQGSSKEKNKYDEAIQIILEELNKH
jgi:alanyl-tRNA synthetase